MEFKYGPMVQGMRDSGRGIKLMVKEPSGMSMEMCLKANGEKIRLMVMVYILIVMELNMKGTGKTTYSMDLVLNSGLTIQSMREITLWGRSMAKAHTNGVMGLNILESGKKIKFMEEVLTFG